MHMLLELCPSIWAEVKNFQILVLNWLFFLEIDHLKIRVPDAFVYAL